MSRTPLIQNKENTGYQIKRQTGLFESFEREYYDLIRSAFLKFQYVPEPRYMLYVLTNRFSRFQVRIGNMDGIFVAYHNTLKLFGFQYVPLHEMDERLFGSHELGDQVFSKCLAILEVLAEEIVGCFPNEVRLGPDILFPWLIDCHDSPFKQSVKLVKARTL